MEHGEASGVVGSESGSREASSVGEADGSAVPDAVGLPVVPEDEASTGLDAGPDVSAVGDSVPGVPAEGDGVS